MIASFRYETSVRFFTLVHDSPRQPRLRLHGLSVHGYAKFSVRPFKKYSVGCRFAFGMPLVNV
jgi:hypothetical protein